MKNNMSEQYKSLLSLSETLEAVTFVYDNFKSTLCDKLNLTHIPCPLFVAPESGLNDNLNDVEQPVSFVPLFDSSKKYEIVHSLAKWKRWTLFNMDSMPGTGIVTNMKAIRKDEEPSNIHSIFVDQYDYEVVIKKEDRNLEFLFKTANKIYTCIREVEQKTFSQYGCLQLGDDMYSHSEQMEMGVYDDNFVLKKKELHFVSTQELENMYPDLTPKEREHKACQLWGSVFIYKIGGKLKSGQKHDGRAPDYDDWSLNGDILVWYDLLGQSVELSSMGIRVDKKSLMSQCKESGTENKLKMTYQKAILDEILPYTIGGGIGQSRLAMLLLRKLHIGEVQYSQWPDKYREDLKSKGVHLL